MVVSPLMLLKFKTSLNEPPSPLSVNPVIVSNAPVLLRESLTELYEKASALACPVTVKASAPPPPVKVSPPAPAVTVSAPLPVVMS